MSHLKKVFDSIDERKEQMDYLDSLNPDEVFKLAKKDSYTKEALCYRHSRLVTKAAKAFHIPGYTVDDVWQTGFIGLIKAIDTYDPEKGFQFSTYAMNVINRELINSLTRNAAMIRYPSYIITRALSCKKEFDRIENDTGIRPTADIVAKKLGISSEQVDSAMSFFNTVELSLDSLEENENDSIFEGIYLQDINVDVENTIVTAMECGEVIRLFDKLFPDKGNISKETAKKNKRMKDIILFKYGYFDGEEHTLQECSDIIGTSRERVRQLEKNALSKMRMSMGVPIKKKAASA